MPRPADAAALARHLTDAGYTLDAVTDRIGATATAVQLLFPYPWLFGSGLAPPAFAMTLLGGLGERYAAGGAAPPPKTPGAAGADVPVLEAIAVIRAAGEDWQAALGGPAPAAQSCCAT